MAKAASKAKATGFDPTKNIATTKASSKSTLAAHQAKGVVADSVDQYVKLHAQIKLLEGQQDKFKDAVLIEAKKTFANRVFDGTTGNLKILGNAESVTFITQNSGSNLLESDLEVIATFGKKAVESLTEPDLSNLKFKPDFISESKNRKRLFDALAKEFSSDELTDMFQPLAHKVTATAIESAVIHVKTADELADLYAALKLKAYIKA
jgi:hypothetical protein